MGKRLGNIAMWKFNVLASSLTARWELKQILSHLPTPGTPSFVALYEALRPYGLNTNGYKLEGQAKLADVILTLSLRDTITVRMSYDWIELAVLALSNLRRESQASVQQRQPFVAFLPCS